MVFQAVRNPATHVGVAALGPILGWSGVGSRVPFFTLIALVYLLFWRRKIGFYTAGLLAMASFINFNPVLFLQYFAWFTPFFPLAASEAFPGGEPASAIPAAGRISATGGGPE